MYLSVFIHIQMRLIALIVASLEGLYNFVSLEGSTHFKCRICMTVVK